MKATPPCPAGSARDRRALAAVVAALMLLAVALPARADAPAAPPPAAPSAADIERAVARGVNFLVKSQKPDGSWGSARNTKDLNIFAPVPGSHQAFHAAVTAMAIEALIETGADRDNPAARVALDRAEAWLLEHLPKVRRADGIALYNVWTHGYGIQALVAMHRRATNNPARQTRLRELIRGQMDLLQRYESVDGGWGYYDFKYQTQRPTTDSISFVTATMLIAFHDARMIGVEPPPLVVKRAIAAINRQRKHDDSYLYGEYLKLNPQSGINRPAGSLGRSQACNLALRQWGDETITDAVLHEWLDRLVERNGWLSIGRKRPVPHESWFQVAGYFFYYGHYYAARCIEALGEGGARHRGPLAGVLLSLQEKDGSWWDFPFYDYHQPYGTAFALMSLQRCRTTAR